LQTYTDWLAFPCFYCAIGGIDCSAIIAPTRQNQKQIFFAIIVRFYAHKGRLLNIPFTAALAASETLYSSFRIEFTVAELADIVFFQKLFNTLNCYLQRYHFMTKEVILN
jgi:hypothetical protein